MGSIVISGASRGLGAALASGFAQRGQNVFAGMRQTDCEPPAGCTALTLDVTDRRSVSSAIEKVAEAGPIDILVNNAGVHTGGSIEDIEEAAFQQAMEVNLFGAWRLTRAALPHMMPGSLIVMISSLSGLVGLPEDGAYAATKFALEGLSQSLAAEVKSRGIRVIIIEPSGIATGFAGNEDGETAEAVAGQIIALCADTPADDLRFPLGDSGAWVARELDLDRGSKWRAIVAAVSDDRGTDLD